MSDFASNVPISRPRKMPWEISWDCNGLVWSNDYGIFFDVQDHQEPIALPSRMPQSGGGAR